MLVLKSETKLEALREAQSVVYNVQSGLNQRIENLAIRVAISEALANQPGQLRVNTSGLAPLVNEGDGPEPPPRRGASAG